MRSSGIIRNVIEKAFFRMQGLPQNFCSAFLSSKVSEDSLRLMITMNSRLHDSWNAMYRIELWESVNAYCTFF